MAPTNELWAQLEDVRGLLLVHHGQIEIVIIGGAPRITFQSTLQSTGSPRILLIPPPVRMCFSLRATGQASGRQSYKEPIDSL